MNTEPIGTATYSPEDNKLRLYPFARLPRELYDRVKAAGFSWAPKQELFVAPMWTPGRADLLEELCGDIGDEDKSLAERAEARAERFDNYSDRRAADAESARQGVAAIAGNIPFGQPILIGHHSEKRARKDAERIENGMRRAVKMWEASEYWTDRAAGAVAAAKYKELPGVRSRRIKTIEADRRKMERTRAEHEHCLKFWRGECVFTNQGTQEKRKCEITEENREMITRILGHSSTLGYLHLPKKEGDRPDWDQHCTAHTELAHDFPNLYARRTVAECQEAAFAVYPRAIERADRWLAHYDNRLAYERAMLAEAGGLVTDKTGPEVGGAIRATLWTPRGGGWAYIRKVNRITVTIYHRWNDGGRVFPHNMPLEKIQQVMTKAEVEAARAAGRIQEVEGVGFYLTPEPSPDQPKQPTKEPATAAKKEGTQFEAMKQTLRAGVQVVSAPQLFPTPEPIARRMVELAGIEHGARVLEPSAGTGVLLHAIRNAGLGAVVTAVEINYDLANQLRTSFDDVRHADFLGCNGDLGKFDRVVMNPPFQNGDDIKHILHAREMLKPGGRLVALCANGPRQQAALQSIADHWEALPPGSFAEQGTGVNVALLVITETTP